MEDGTRIVFFIETQEQKLLSLTRRGDWKKCVTYYGDGKCSNYCMLHKYWEEMETHGFNPPGNAKERDNLYYNPDQLKDAVRELGTPLLTLDKASWWFSLFQQYNPDCQFRIVKQIRSQTTEQCL